MTLLKNITSILMTVISISSFAQSGGGGGGGGVVRPDARINNAQLENLRIKEISNLIKPKEIIFNIEEKEDTIEFAYGQANQNAWDIQKLEVNKADLIKDTSVIKALEESKVKKDWSEIK